MLIQYPDPAFRIKKEDAKEHLFDPLRKKWVVLTPEEWVRQNFVQFLVQVQKFPATLIALEKEIQLGERKKRFDILVYDRQHQPLMMVECKASEVKLDETVLQQVLLYNISVPVDYIVITNGNETYVWHRSEQGLHLVQEFPSPGQ